MKNSMMKWLAATVGAVAIGVGCNSAFQHIADEASGGSGSAGTGDGFATVDSDFSDDASSPGGTGGSTDTGSGETGNVELPGEETRSFFTAFQIDPIEEDTAGPKFVVSGDVDQDGLTDLVTAWNQSQPVELHLQRVSATGTISFRTITIAGTSPVAIVAGVELGQINDDGWLDIVVLVKATGGGGWCPTDPPSEISELEGEIIVYFNPGDANQAADGDQWTQMILSNPYVSDRWIHNQFPGNNWTGTEDAKTHPENNGFTALAVGDLDGNPGDEIVVALNPGTCEELGQKPPTNTVDVWVNPGAGLAETSAAWGVPADLPFSRGVPISIMLDAPLVTDITLSDVDGDGDLDVVAAYSNSLSLNVRWARNPLVPSGFAAFTAGGSDGPADSCEEGEHDGEACPNGDSDCEGGSGSCTNGTCVGGPFNGESCQDNAGCEGEDGDCVAWAWHYVPSNWEIRPVGQIDTNASVLAIGDVDNDGFDDVLVRSTPGKLVQWFRKPNPLVVEPEFPPNDTTPERFNFPWPVFTVTEFLDQEPEAIALGDVTGDGKVELMVAVEGGVYWYDGTVGATVYDPWTGNTIIQDAPTDSGGTADSGTSAPGGTGVGVMGTDASTVINALLVVDLDGDGKNDVVGTLDRRSGSGLSDDRLVWYKNTQTDE
ncbi:MAG: VCBS repeat-containing protein [Planctomycetota bacterium]